MGVALGIRIALGAACHVHTVVLRQATVVV
jgi:hypothetical protein